MTHLRKTIRDAAATAVTGLATTSTRVYKSRNLPLVAAEFPCVLVFARSDSPDYEGAAFSGGVAYPVRSLELHVQGYAKDTDSSAIEDTLDTIAEEVETAIFDAAFTGALGVRLGGQSISVDASGDETLGVVDMVFVVLYRTAEGTPGTAF